MDDVARHLCISKKTLYEYFQDKEELVRSVVFLEHEAGLKLYSEIQKQEYNAVEELLEVYRLLHKKFQEYHPSMEYDIRKYYPDLFIEIKEVRRKYMIESFLRNLNKGKKEGLYRKEMNSRIIAKLHLLRIENMSETDLFSDEKLSSQQIFHEMFIYHLHGILSPAGLTFFDSKIRKQKDSITWT